MKVYFVKKSIPDGLAFGIGCGLVLMVAILLRLPTLASRSLWLDETYSAWFSALSIAELWTKVPLYETHPPMFYSLLKGWRLVFGASEAGLRSLSLVASALTVLLVACTGRLLRLSKNTDPIFFLAALFLAFNAGSVEYAQQARPYAIETLAAYITIISSIGLITNLIIRDPANRPVNTKACFTPLVLAGALTMWSHNTGMFILFGIWSGMITVILLFSGENTFKKLKIVAYAGILVIILWMPFFPMFLRQNAGMSSMTYWITFHMGDIWKAAELVSGGRRSIMILAVFGAIGIYGLWRWNRAVALHIVTLLLLPFLVSVIYSMAIKPLFVPRLFVWMTPVMMVLVATGLATAISNSGVRSIIAIGILGLSFTYVLNYYNRETENWRGLIESIAKDTRDGDIIIALPNEINMPLAYYGAGKKLPQVLYLPGPFPALALTRSYVGNLGAPVFDKDDLRLIAEAEKNNNRIILFLRHPEVYDQAGLVDTHLSMSRKVTKVSRSLSVSVSTYEH